LLFNTLNADNEFAELKTPRLDLSKRLALLDVLRASVDRGKISASALFSHSEQSASSPLSGGRNRSSTVSSGDLFGRELARMARVEQEQHRRSVSVTATAGSASAPSEHSASGSTASAVSQQSAAGPHRLGVDPR
jgi:hypothetical protein